MPIETPWHEAQRQLYELIGADFEGCPNDFCAALATNLCVAAMLAEAALRGSR